MNEMGINLTNSNDRNWIKSYIVDVLPCVSVAMYVLAIIYNISFFSAFNFSVIPYISLGDILLSIVEPLLIVAFSILMMCWQLYVFMHTIFLIEAEEKEKSEYNTCFHFKILRLLVRLKAVKWINKIFNRRQRNKKKGVQKVKGDNKTFEIIQDITYVIAISLLLYNYFIYPDRDHSGLDIATIGMLLPLLIVFFIIVIGKRVDSLSKRLQKYLNIDYRQVFIAIIIYYVYSIFIFIHSGIKTGQQILENNKITFNIKTNDGHEFNDSTYIYIDYMGGNYFLYEKKTEDIVVINIEGLSYTKVNYHDDRHNSSLVRTGHKVIMEENH